MSEPLLKLVTDVLDRVRPVDSGMYGLYLANRKIIVRKPIKAPRDAALIFKITADGINFGLTSLQWDLILLKLNRLRDLGFI